jgi:transcriptional regulator with XRE-family HTH domain
MDDQVISQTDIVQRESVPSAAPPADRRSPLVGFSLLLERLREERGLSKADLAKRAGLDPSSITRFEQGNRHPDRETVLLLANTLTLPLVDRDRLLASAGYRSELWDNPLLVDLSYLLNDRDLPDHVREEVRTVLKAALAYGRLSRLDIP